MKEHWKTVEGFEGLYEVSDQSRVRSLDRRVPTRGGVTRLVKGRILKSTRNGTCIVVDLSKNGKSRTSNVRFLMADAFIPKSKVDPMEHWKTIADFEAYEVSNMGEVRRKLSGCGTRVGLKLKPGAHDGYLKITLCKEHKKFTRDVHRLVAEAFIPNPLKLPEVNHLGLKSDCRATMLEWRTTSGNRHHALLTGKLGNNVIHVSKNTWRVSYNLTPNTPTILYFRTKAEALAARRAFIEALPYVL